MNRPGDWNCRSCQHLNFQRRESCQRCGDPKPVGAGGGGLDLFGSFGGGRMGASSSSLGFSTGPDVRPGDWYCTVGNCGAHNFASRSGCFKCGASKEDSSSGGGIGGGIGGGFDGGDHMSRMMRGGYGFGAGSSSGGRSGWKSGDWICTRCKEHNFASRTECYRCNAPREAGSKSPF